MAPRDSLWATRFLPAGSPLTTSVGCGPASLSLVLVLGANPKRQTEGVGAAMALVFGMRASEITSLQVRDLDAGGTIIRITHAKSQAGIRSLQVPEWFRPHLEKLAEGKKATDPLVGHDRTWLHRNVRAILPKGRDHRGTTTRLAWNPRRPCALGGGDAALGEQGTRARITNHHVSTLRRRRNRPESRT